MINQQEVLIQQCLICLDYPRDVYIISCCGKGFCRVCIESHLKKDSRCCNCRSDNPKIVKDSILQQKIKNLIIPCMNFQCKQKIKNQKYEEHITKYCSYLKLNCIYCQSLILKKDYVQHCIKYHRQKLQEFFLNKLPQYKKQNQNKKPQSKQLILNYKPNQELLNRSGNLAKRGTTGLYYCNKSLKDKKCTCNGMCGPNNGCCCLDCMILNRNSQNIRDKTILLNSSNRRCKILNGKKVYCGIFLQQYEQQQQQEQQSYCNINYSCKSCLQLSKGIQRYKQIYE